MSLPDLPPEILNSVVDLLLDEPETLKQCCLVSKSWVPRTRKHLFSFVVFRTKRSINGWKKTFPNPSDSPANYTHVLMIGFLGAIIEDGCIPAFPRLARLEVDETPGLGCGYMMNPVAFQEFPHTLKSLSVDSLSIPTSQVFNLIRSLPFLEDLSLTSDAADIDDNDPDDPHIVVPSSTSPPFTGVLQLCMFQGTAGTARRLLDLPNGLHFRKLQFQWCGRGDLDYIMKLVMACSDTLECLDIASPPEDQSALIQIDLSKATRLQNITFRSGSLRTGWITRTLETITAEHRGFQQICVDLERIRVLVGVDPSLGWPDLDRLLVRLRESRSIRATLRCVGPPSRVAGYAARLLPELTKRGIIDLLEELA